jgi:CRISPR/Cas system-associated endoribonuclease Cas2
MKELNGTEKQVKWAMDIRQRKLEKIEKVKGSRGMFRNYYNVYVLATGKEINPAEFKDLLDEVSQYIKDCESSQFFIHMDKAEVASMICNYTLGNLDLYYTM